MRAHLLFFACACALGALGCGNGTKAAAADAGVEAGDDAALEASSCSSGGPCGAPGDCVQPGTVAGCWQCILGCCLPVPPTSDPQKTCDAGSACLLSGCDGAGSCLTPSTAKDGTPCGTTCGGVFVYGRSTCRAGSCEGDPLTQKACPDRCFGDYTDCPGCAAAGCVASCDPLPTPDRCFP
jgi:hypothetical protein